MQKMLFDTESNAACDSQNLNIDEACLKIISSLSSAVDIFTQSEECDKCGYVWSATIPSYQTEYLTLSTVYPYNFYYQLENASHCQEQHKFEEHGVYAWNLTDEGCPDIYVIKQPVNSYLPIWYAAIVYFLIIVIWRIGKCIYHSEYVTRLRMREVQFLEIESDLGSPSPSEAPPRVVPDVTPVIRSRTRVKSLDTFRGISIAVMIFVNYGGGHYWFFKHSVWNGLTVADLVFPWFLWIMGVSLAISLRSQLRGSLPRRQLLFRVMKRSIVLIALGIILNSTGKNSLTELRIPGVLQRIGLAYFVVAAVETALMKPQGSFQYGRWLVIQDILDSWLQWLIVLTLMAMHVVLTLLLHVPGCPTGYLGPGGDHDHGVAQNCTGGAAGYIDRLVFGDHHIYQHPTCKRIYHTSVPYDPEGLLGTLTSVLMVFLGVHAGRILLSYHYTFMRMLRWCAWSLITGIIAGVLCGFSKNDGVIPVNKNLWSLSFVLALASMAFLVQSLLYFIIDAKRWWSGAPFYYAGMNAILLYIGHEITQHMFPWSWKPFYNNHAEFLAMNLWGTTLWIIIAFVLYRKQTFITL